MLISIAKAADRIKKPKYSVDILNNRISKAPLGLTKANVEACLMRSSHRP
jgi:hypothetical protein